MTIFNNLKKRSLLKIDLGSGPRPRSGYLGVDSSVDSNFVIKKDALTFLKSLPKNSTSHIYSRHFLEHTDSVQMIKILKEIDRILIKKGEILFILPHYSNPFFYSDPTHKTFFGVHTFSYLCETSCLNRNVPGYASIKGWHLKDIKINFVPMLKIRFFGFRLPFLSDVLNLVLNTNLKLLELYERYFASFFSIYEVKYFIIKN
jgi:hypothetical protein